MNSIPTYFLVFIPGLLLQGKMLAAGDLPLLGRRGKLLFEDDFARAEIAPRWKIGMGRDAGA